MKKQRSKKICRKRARNEKIVSPEYQKELDKLATQFREDQLKLILRQCYKNVKKYGSEAIMKAIAWWPGPCRTPESSVPENDTTESPPESPRVLHSHEETSQKNALFLLESSECLRDYDQHTLKEMRAAYESGYYDDVADLAYLHDRNRRPVKPVSDVKMDNPPHPSPWHRIAELLEEVASEPFSEEESADTALRHCVEAVRYLSRDLTYENRTAAKDAIRKAISLLE